MLWDPVSRHSSTLPPPPPHKVMSGPHSIVAWVGGGGASARRRSGLDELLFGKLLDRKSYPPNRPFLPLLGYQGQSDAPRRLFLKCRVNRGTLGGGESEPNPPPPPPFRPPPPFSNTSLGGGEWIWWFCAILCKGSAVLISVWEWCWLPPLLFSENSSRVRKSKVQSGGQPHVHRCTLIPGQASGVRGGLCCASSVLSLKHGHRWHQAGVRPVTHTRMLQVSAYRRGSSHGPPPPCPPRPCANPPSPPCASTALAQALLPGKTVVFCAWGGACTSGGGVHLIGSSFSGSCGMQKLRLL